MLTPTNRGPVMLLLVSALTLPRAATAQTLGAGETTRFEILDASLDSLRVQFNRDAQKTRVMLLIDPTCAICLKGASEIQQKVHRGLPDADIATYVVWLPVLTRLNTPLLEREARKEAARISDARVRHFLDPDRVLGKQYSPILRLPPGVLAWDLYFIFAPKVEWEEYLPPPTQWMHQLGWAAPKEYRLNAGRFRDWVKVWLNDPRVKRDPSHSSSTGSLK